MKDESLLLSNLHPSSSFIFFFFCFRNSVKMLIFVARMETNTQTFLIADAGSTKTSWVATDRQGNAIASFETEGINPVHQNEETIVRILTEVGRRLTESRCMPTIIGYYGAGLIPAKRPLMQRLLGEAFPQAAIEAESDLLGAARALCGHGEGIAAILGTGANSCLYDGVAIIQNTPPLGYILGDEGSGAALGKRFLNALFRGTLPAEMRDDYLSSASLTYADVIDRVYRQPQANRFLASTSLYIGKHIAQSEALQTLVTDNFRDFLRHHIVPYHRPELPVSAIGSIAWRYKEQLFVACQMEGLKLGTVAKSPIEGLIAYHCE